MKQTKSAPKSKPLFSQQAIADRAGCSQPLISRMVARGELDEHLVGGKLLETAVETVRAYVTRTEADNATDEELERRLAVAETRLKEAQAQLREIDLEREQGRYVALAEVEADGQDLAIRICTVLRAIPQRTALAVEGALAASPERRAAVIERLISEEVERAIGELRESKFAGEVAVEGGAA